MSGKDQSDNQGSVGANGGKVGNKNPPKSGQFTQTKQPTAQSRAVSRRKKQDAQRPVDPLKIVTEAIYEHVEMKRNGRTVKLPFIEAFVHSMKKNAFSSKLHEQIKFMRELIKLGVFDVEGYKQKCQKWYRQHWRDYIDGLLKMLDRYEVMAKEFKLVLSMYEMYFLTSSLCRSQCTCGAAETNFAPLDNLRLANVIDLSVYEQI